MQITYNQSEIETIVTTHILDTLPGANPEDITSVTLNDDGTATIVIGEEVEHSDATPPVVEKKTRRPRKNPQEAKHRPVETVEETQTTTGGTSETTTSEPEAGQQEEAVEPTEQLKEVATAEAEETASDEVAEEAKTQEEVQEKAVEAPATTKPSLFAGLKKS